MCPQAVAMECQWKPKQQAWLWTAATGNRAPNMQHLSLGQQAELVGQVQTPETSDTRCHNLLELTSNARLGATVRGFEASGQAMGTVGLMLPHLRCCATLRHESLCY